MWLVFRNIKTFSRNNRFNAMFFNPCIYPSTMLWQAEFFVYATAELAFPLNPTGRPIQAMQKKAMRVGKKG
jgi:hypothetical protein